MTVPQPAAENVFDAIAKLLKPEQREYFYQRMMYFRICDRKMKCCGWRSRWGFWRW
jgi:hypothetical protein